jgi:hypothetical protein
MKPIEIEQRKTALQNGNGFCPICHKPLTQMQGAHKIANKELWRKKYGPWVIDNPLNMEIVCSLSCNNSVDVGSSYGKHLEIIADILISEYERTWGVVGLGYLADKLKEKYRGLENG